MNNHNESDSNNRNAPEVPAENESGAFALTGIPALDEILAPIQDKGGLILVAGHDQGGKSTLACQIAGSFIKHSRKVIYWSTESMKLITVPRILASMVPWPMEVIRYYEPPIGAIWGTLKGVDFDKMTEEEADIESLLPVELRRPHSQIECYLDFTQVITTYDELLLQLDEKFAEFPPDCLIFDDWCSYDHEGANALMDRLARYSAKHRIPVFVFCEFGSGECLRSTVDVTELDTPFMYEKSDYFIGISKLSTGHGEKNETDNTDKEQFFTVSHPEGTSLVPVLCDFVFQRYLAREEKQKADGPVNVPGSVEG